MNSVPSIAVIGSGLAGGLLASTLSRSAKVTLFERGRKAHTTPTAPRLSGHPLGLAQTFGYGLGGTTNLWRGSMLAMRPAEFGADWPLNVSQQLRAYSHEVVRLLYGANVADQWEAKQGDLPDSEYILDSIFTPKTPFRIANLYGLKAATLQLVSFVENIRETPTGVVLTVNNDGQIGKLEFDFVVLAGGAINSPLLLKRSGLGGTQVGLNLTDHPMGMVAKVVRGRSSTRYDGMGAVGCWKRVAKFRDKQTGLWTSFQLCPAYDLLFDRDEYLATAQRVNFGNVLKSQYWSKLCKPDYRTMMAQKITRKQRLGGFAFVLAMCEQEARGQGAIDELDHRISLDWQVSDGLCGAITRSISALENWLGCDIHLAPGEVRNRVWSGAHHAGTCRISINPHSGVVDDNLRVHDTSRVFVCDASVLPSTGASNTGLTIGSLVLRLAAHLCRQPIQS